MDFFLPFLNDEHKMVFIFKTKCGIFLKRKFTRAQIQCDDFYAYLKLINITDNCLFQYGNWEFFVCITFNRIKFYSYLLCKKLVVLTHYLRVNTKIVRGWNLSYHILQMCKLVEKSLKFLKYTKAAKLQYSIYQPIMSVCGKISGDFKF